MIALQNLEVSYPDDPFRLRIADLRVGAGEKLALIGPSGSGKTTLMNVIAGIVLPSQGEVRVGDIVVNHLPDSARRRHRLTSVGFVFQDFGLIEYLSALDNILHPYRINKALRLDAAARSRARELAESLGVGQALHKRPGTLSHGERQRVALARALLAEPRLILADEPTGNLDPSNKQKILEMLLVAVERRGATLIAATHDHALLPLFDRVLAMDQVAAG